MAVIDRLNVNQTPAFLKDGVFDISEYNNGAVYTDLSDALGQNGINIPPTIRKGGMIVKFILSSLDSNNIKYMYYILISNIFTINIINWKNINYDKYKSYNYTKNDYVNSLVKEIHIEGTKNQNLKYYVSFCMKSTINDEKFALIISSYNPNTDEYVRVARFNHIDKSGLYFDYKTSDYITKVYITLENQNSNINGLNYVSYSEEYELNDNCWGDLENAPIIKLYDEYSILYQKINDNNIFEQQEFSLEQLKIARQNIGISNINPQNSSVLTTEESVKITDTDDNVIVNIHHGNSSDGNSIVIKTDDNDEICSVDRNGFHSKTIFYGALNINLENKISDIEFQIGSGTNKDVVLIMFMGQSNMAGRGVISSTHPQDAPTVINGAGYEFRAISDPTQLYPITKTFGNTEDNPDGINDGGRKTGGPVPSFVNSFYRVAHTTVIGVSASRGGSPITSWLPNTPYMTDALSRMQSAVSYLTSNGYNILAKYVLWCQGEKDADTGMLPSVYETNFNSMASTLFNAGIEKIFIMRIGKYNNNASGADPNVSYDDIINELNLLCKNNDNYIMATTVLASLKDKGLMKDQFHFFQEGYNIAGTYSGIHTANYFLFRKSDTMYDIMTNSMYFDSKTY